jgi:hypothetical protein
MHACTHAHTCTHKRTIVYTKQMHRHTSCTSTHIHTTHRHTTHSYTQDRHTNKNTNTKTNPLKHSHTRLREHTHTHRQERTNTHHTSATGDRILIPNELTVNTTKRKEPASTSCLGASQRNALTPSSWREIHGRSGETQFCESDQVEGERAIY